MRIYLLLMISLLYFSSKQEVRYLSHGIINLHSIHTSGINYWCSHSLQNILNVAISFTIQKIIARSIETLNFYHSMR